MSRVADYSFDSQLNSLTDANLYKSSLESITSGGLENAAQSQKSSIRAIAIPMKCCKTDRFTSVVGNPPMRVRYWFMDLTEYFFLKTYDSFDGLLRMFFRTTDVLNRNQGDTRFWLKN